MQIYDINYQHLESPAYTENGLIATYNRIVFHFTLALNHVAHTC